MKTWWPLLLVTMITGCYSASPVEEPIEVAPPAYLASSWDITTEPWHGEYEGHPFMAYICSYHAFYSEGVFVEQIYCHTEMMISEQVVPCPILMVRLDLEDIALGTTEHHSAHPMCAMVMPVFETTAPLKETTPVNRRKPPERKSPPPTGEFALR